MSFPVFTTRHYEFMAKELGRRGVPASQIDLLCSIFKQDNPNFKEQIFRNQIEERKAK